MRERCLNPNNIRYDRYGGRGITICARWYYGEAGLSGFACFCADMGPKQSPRHTLDRIDNDGNYEPGNCRWATPREQANNSRRNHFITMAGRTLSLADWSRQLNFPYNELRALVVYGKKLFARSERTSLTAAASARC
jgi:hypothetical protein